MKKRSYLTVPTLLLSLALLSPAISAGRADEVRTEAHRLLNQGVAAYKRGEFAVAVDRLDQAAGMALNNFRAHYFLGMALIGDRRYSQAVEALEIAIDLDPNHLQVHIGMGNAQLMLGDLPQARASYFLALKLRPEYAAALDGIARLHEAQGDDHQARTHYVRAISQNRGFAPAYTHLGDLYLRKNQFQEAVMLLEEAVSVRPDFAAGLNRLALAYGRLGLHNEAVSAINKAMQLEPNDAGHPAALGQVQLDEGYVTAGEKWFVRALELDPGLPQARTGLAEVARRRGDYGLALGQIAGVLVDPRLDARTREEILEYRERLETERSLVLALERRIDSGEASPADHAELAAIYAGRHEWSRAVELQQGAGADPQQLQRLAYLLFRAGRFREAQQLYARLGQDESTAEIEINHGVSQALLGNDAAAVSAYDRALALETDRDLALLYRGNSLLRLGRQDEAVQSYLTYLDQRSTGEAAERIRRILKQIAPESLPDKLSPLELDEAEPPTTTAAAAEGRP